MRGRYVPPAPVPAEARELVDAILARHAAFWDGMKAFNRSERPTGAMLDAASGERDSAEALEDQLRRAFFRRAARVTVDEFGVYTWSPTGRVVRQVWKIEQVREPIDW